MSERIVVEPDVEFVNRIRGKEDEAVKLCCQCASCSVTCQISPMERPFPRKEMIWVQWGLRDRLLADPDIWLCYQCNDCSINCPRQSFPGDIFARLREYIFQHFSFPRFMGSIVSSPKLLPVFFLIPIVILLGVFSVWGNLGIPEGEIIYNKVFPSLIVKYFFLIGSIVMLIFLFVSLIRFWRQLRMHSAAGESNGKTKGSLIGSIIDTVTEIITHKQFGECNENTPRKIGHLMVLYSFIGLVITTGIVASMMWFTDTYYEVYPFKSMAHPVKILGNVSALFILIGLGILFYMRFSRNAKVGGSTYVDWMFISVLTITVVTGILAQTFRFAEMAAATYIIYFTHLVFTFTLILYLPYTKFAHMMYRFTAIVFAKYHGR